MTAVRDVVGLWLVYLIPWAAIVVSFVAVFWIGMRLGQGRAERRCWCASSETVVIPLQREASR